MFDPLQRVSDASELTFGRLCFLIEGMPPQLNRPSAVVPVGKKHSQSIAVSHFRLSHPRKGMRNGSCLRFEVPTVPQLQTAVKLHGVFVSPKKSSACTLSSGFTRSTAGTVERSLRHSCKPPIKRRGITLP